MDILNEIHKRMGEMLNYPHPNYIYLGDHEYQQFRERIGALQIYSTNIERNATEYAGMEVVRVAAKTHFNLG